MNSAEGFGGRLGEGAGGVVALLFREVRERFARLVIGCIFSVGKWRKPRRSGDRGGNLTYEITQGGFFFHRTLDDE